MILTSEAIHFLSSKKKIEFLRQIEANKDENNVPPVKLLTREKVLNPPHVTLFSCNILINFITFDVAG